jgi:hypothetical protein
MSILLAAVLFGIWAYTNKSNTGFYLDNNLQLTFADNVTDLNTKVLQSHSICFLQFLSAFKQRQVL